MRSELKKARLSEAEAQKSKKELVAKLSHDIKTPIASLRAYAEGLEANLATSPEYKNIHKRAVRKNKGC